MEQKPLLLPEPRHLSMPGGIHRLEDQQLIILNGADPQALRFTARQLQRHLKEYADLSWEIVVGTTFSYEPMGAALTVVPGSTYHPEGYELTVTSRGIHAVASTNAGLFYAVQTLCQVIEQSHRNLPILHVHDWPDFSARGVMIDISRDKVPKMETLYKLVDMLASWKVNQLQLYTEHTFAYRNHSEVWAEASPMTGEEILNLDAYCRERFIELVPNQNSFGHMTRWLTHDRYRPLAEVPQGDYVTRWGHFTEPYSLCPTDPESLQLVRDLFDELLPHFSSRLFNVGCDETIDLGVGRSRSVCEEEGGGRVYLDFLLKIYREVKARGRIMQFWGDIIMEHPELVPELPRDAVALEWGYEGDHPFDSHGALFAASGIPFYVCPGTSTWNSIAGRTENAIQNIENAASNGLKHGAIGLLNTDWGDNGHWQPLPASYLGYAYGAALSWDYETNRDLDVAKAISRFAFRDESGKMGRIAYDLGNVGKETGVSSFNANILFLILQVAPDQLISLWQGEEVNAQGGPRSGRLRIGGGRVTELQRLNEAGLRHSLDCIDKIAEGLDHVELGSQDADLVQREYRWAAQALRHGCLRGLWLLGRANGKEDTALRSELAKDAACLVDEYRALWLERNRPGGLRDSVARMEMMQHDYEQ